MSVLDNIKALLRTNGHVEAQTKETLVKCFEQLLAGTGEISSPAGTIDVRPGNPTTIEVTGLPSGDITSELGAFSRRWVGLVTDYDGGIKFDNGAGLFHLIGWVNGTGPRFYDFGTTKSLLFDVQDFTGNRTATWADESGLVMYVEDFSFGPTISVITEGSTTTSSADYLYNVFIHSAAGDLTAANYALNTPFYHARAAPMVFIAFKIAITTLTLTGSNMSNTGLSLTPSITAGQTIGLTWDVGLAKWIRFQ